MEQNAQIRVKMILPFDIVDRAATLFAVTLHFVLTIVTGNYNIGTETPTHRHGSVYTYGFRVRSKRSQRKHHAIMRNPKIWGFLLLECSTYLKRSKNKYVLINYLAWKAFCCVYFLYGGCVMFVVPECGKMERKISKHFFLLVSVRWRERAMSAEQKTKPEKKRRERDVWGDRNCFWGCVCFAGGMYL